MVPVLSFRLEVWKSLYTRHGQNSNTWHSKSHFFCLVKNLSACLFCEPIRKVKFAWCLRKWHVCFTPNIAMPCHTLVVLRFYSLHLFSGNYNLSKIRYGNVRHQQKSCLEISFMCIYNVLICIDDNRIKYIMGILNKTNMCSGLCILDTSIWKQSEL